MSEAAVRRNPTRTARNRVPRHPDSPVSYALPPAPDSPSDEYGSDTDTELTRDLATGFLSEAQDRATQNYVAMHPEVFEIRDSPSPEPVEEFLFRDNGGEAAKIDFPRADAPDIDEVDDKEGSVQERATKLIGNILRLRSLDAWPALTTAVARPRSPSPPPLLDTVSTTYTTLQGGVKALYFVGIQTLTGCRTFCESRAFSDPHPQDGALFLRLQNSGGPLSRALAGLTDRSSYYVGTSDFPIDITGSHANYQFNFREINTLLDLENTYAMSNVFIPTPESVMRSELLRTQGQPDTIVVYVLYVYHRNIDPFATHAAPLSNGAFEATTPNDVQAYLRQRFAVQLEELRIWRARDYGSAYHHCLIERQVVRICHALGIGMLGRVHTPAVVGVMSIRLEDVVSAAGINFQTFGTYRTEFQRIREAHTILRQRHHNRALSPDHEPLYHILDAMMAERVLDTACTPGHLGQWWTRRKDWPPDARLPLLWVVYALF
ncbi:hypothetical protein B0H14DRAFT_3630679 [Mycena olivaceomarginata]|nr:hypothetical protein B0H14DRAFT_3630679 [Mycena olivaceomarginata]